MNPNNVDSWATVTFAKGAPVTYYIRVYTDENRIIKTSTTHTYTVESEFKEALKSYVSQVDIVI